MKNSYLQINKTIVTTIRIGQKRGRILLLLSFLLFFFMGTKANPVDNERARQAAKAFLNINGVKSAGLTDVSATVGFSNVYVFTTENSFVLIAADDRVQPVLGYSLNGRFDFENMPINKRAWIQGYNIEIQYAIEHHTRASFEVTRQWRDLMDGNPNTIKVTTEVVPLIQTKWDQNGPYNNLCPVGTVTGCAATAMAQILKYWNYPTSGVGLHSYRWNGQILSADFGNTVYDWDNMLNIYDQNSTEAQKTAVATLMFHCGVSLNMNYGSEWSGGSSAYSSATAGAFINYFNYSPETQLYSRSGYSDGEWINMVRSELNQNRPLWYTGSGSGGGHAFVCDGYNNDGFFHFNWGWGGYCDEYYTINDLNPGPGGIGSGSVGEYNNNQQALFGAQPSPASSADAPTLTANLITGPGVRNAQLNWNVVDNAVSYYVYRNGTLIYTTTSGNETSYLDVHIDYGTTVYYLRSMDENGIFSWSSNYAPVTIIFAAPTDVSAEQVGGDIQLSWIPSEWAVAYNIFCNNCLIGNVIGQTTYNDTRSIAGDLNYYIIGIDEFGDESKASNTTSLTIPFTAPVVDNLEAIVSGNTVKLSWSAPDWCYPETPSDTLCYGNNIYNGYFGYNFGDTYWGHRYPAEDLGAYSNNYIYKVSLYARVAGKYELLVYEGTTGGHPQTQVRQQTVWIESEGWFDIDLTEKIQINASSDYWVFFHDVEGIFRPATYCTYNGEKGNYYSKNPASGVDTQNGVAFLIHTYLTDGIYTYNLYRNNISIANNVNSTIYSDNNLPNGIYDYYVKTNCFSSESTASNLVSVQIGDINNLIITVSANPSHGGNVVGGGIFSYGQNCTVMATAATGYTFSNWTENGIVVSTDAHYTFSVSSTRNLIANFTNNNGLEEKESSIITLYPNPTKDKLTVEAFDPINLFEIYTIKGDLVYRQKDNSEKIEINLENYSIGIYTVRVTTEGAAVVRSFLKE